MLDSILAQGLNSLTTNLITNWIGPAFLLLIAIVAIVMAWQRKLAAFFTFALVGVIAAVLIYGGAALFGANGVFTRTGTDLAKEVNVVVQPLNITDETH